MVPLRPAQQRAGSEQDGGTSSRSCGRFTSQDSSYERRGRAGVVPRRPDRHGRHSRVEAGLRAGVSGPASSSGSVPRCPSSSSLMPQAKVGSEDSFGRRPLTDGLPISEHPILGQIFSTTLSAADHDLARWSRMACCRPRTARPHGAKRATPRSTPARRAACRPLLPGLHVVALREMESNAHPPSPPGSMLMSAAILEGLPGAGRPAPAVRSAGPGTQLARDTDLRANDYRTRYWTVPVMTEQFVRPAQTLLAGTCGAGG